MGFIDPGSWAGDIAMQMLFHLPIKLGAVLTAAVSAALLSTNSYRRVRTAIIGLASLMGLAFLFELAFVHVGWPAVAAGMGSRPRRPGDRPAWSRAATPSSPDCSHGRV